MPVSQVLCDTSSVVQLYCINVEAGHFHVKRIVLMWCFRQLHCQYWRYSDASIKGRYAATMSPLKSYYCRNPLPERRDPRRLVVSEAETIIYTPDYVLGCALRLA